MPPPAAKPAPPTPVRIFAAGGGVRRPAASPPTPRASDPAVRQGPDHRRHVVQGQSGPRRPGRAASTTGRGHVRRDVEGRRQGPALGHTNDDGTRTAATRRTCSSATTLRASPRCTWPRDLIGDDAIALADRVEVSINAEPELEGRRRQDVLRLHHAHRVCHRPGRERPGPLHRFRSPRGRGTVEVPVFRMSQESTMNWQPLATAPALTLQAHRRDVARCVHDRRQAGRDRCGRPRDREYGADRGPLQIAALKAGNSPRSTPTCSDDAADTTASKIDLRPPASARPRATSSRPCCAARPTPARRWALSRKAAGAAGSPTHSLTRCLT